MGGGGIGRGGIGGGGKTVLVSITQVGGGPTSITVNYCLVMDQLLSINVDSSRLIMSINVNVNLTLFLIN